MINMCANVGCVGETTDGAFAEYVLVKKDRLYLLNDTMDLEAAVMVEPVACVLNGFNRLHFLPGQTAIIYGAGPIGLLFSSLLKSAGAACVILSELSDTRIAHAKQYSKADAVIKAGVRKASDVLFEYTGQRGADVVIDAVGTLMDQAVDDAAFSGTVLLFGVNDQVSQTLKQYDITHKELTMVSSFATQNTFVHAIKLLNSGVLDMTGVITERIGLEQVIDTMEKLRNGKGTKAVVYPQPEQG